MLDVIPPAHFMSPDYYGPHAHGPLSILFVILAVIAVIALLRWAFHGRHGGWGKHKGDTALGTLRDRYAKGEIDDEEFERRKQGLA